jgi:hypothetical protein
VTFFELSQMQNANSKSHEGNFAKPKIGNCQLTEACFTKLMLEGEGDTFSFIANKKQQQITQR